MNIFLLIIDVIKEKSLYRGSEICLINRAAARRWPDHVGAAGALWKMMCNANSVNLLATWELMSFATYAPCVRKLVKFVVGFPIPGSTPNPSWLWSHPENRPWVVKHKYCQFIDGSALPDCCVLLLPIKRAPSILSFSF